MDDDVRISSGPIDVGTTIAAVRDSRAGGIAIFLGVTRAETNPSGERLIALDYEAYEEMALKQMRQLAADARGKWPIISLAIVHRIGRVLLEEPSVVIAVATPHRGEAFEACRWLIDTLKAQTAIWKKEIWSGGAQTWIHPS